MILVVSPSNTDIVRSMWAAYERRGLEAILAFAAPDAEWVPYTASGRRFATTAEYGDSVVVSGRLRLRTHEGISDTSMHWVHRLRDGKIVYTASYPSLQQAMDAAGLG